jgi:hypothetical protein
MKEEGKMDAPAGPVFIEYLEDPFHQGGLSRTGLSLDPEQTMIICYPFLILFVLENPCTRIRPCV